MVTIIQKHIILIVFLYFVTSINSQTIDEEYNPDYLKWLEKTTQEVSAYGFVLGEIPAPYKVHTELPEYLKEQIITRDFLARKYDLRDVTGALTSVKNQGGCGSCWTFATMGALEARWQITGKGTYDLSEDNLNTCHTPFLWAPCKGGNRELALAYLSRGSGPKLETDDPYSQYNTSVDCPDGLIPQGIVTSGWFLPSTDSDLLKNMIMDYGALYTNMRWEDASYNSANKTYYYSGTGSTNHAVLLVGWDDDKVTAGGTGAWIIKNSWGASMGESGYFYIAYQDSKVNSTVALFKDYKDYNPYETISTYSEAGWIGSFGYSSSSADALVKFSASGNIHLTKIGTYTNYPGAVVTIDIYDSFNGTNSLTGLLGSVSAQTCTYSGYHTFDIDEPISIEDGDDYYIKIRYQTTGYNYPIPVEMSSGGYVTAELETGVFWIKSTSGSNWSAITSTYDPCVYVYSNTNDIMLTDGSAYKPQPVIPNSNNNSIGRFKLNAQTSGAILNSINFTFSGTPSGINNVKLWSSSDSVYGGDTQIGESQLYSSTITFSGLTSEITEDGNYYFLTVDLGESTGEISAFISDNSAIEISGGTVAGTILNAKLSKDGNVLPVELISFNSTISFGKVLVNWQTATEVNNFGFEVERSTVKGEWLTIGFVEGAGNSNSPKYYSYTDFNVNSISAYKSDDILKYRLKQIDTDGQIAYSDIIAINISELKSLPQEFSLEQNYPNPFNPVTTIGFNLPEKCNVKINVFNILGKNITKITDREYQAGFHKAEFNAAYLPSGVYYYKIETSNGNSAVKKMLLLK